MSDTSPSGSPPSEPATPTSRRRFGLLSWIVLYTRGILFDQHLRHLVMFYVLVAALLMAFSGDVFFSGWLRERGHLIRFVVYWFVCAWLTLLAALLAIYDILLLRIQHRVLHRKLREQILGVEPGSDGDRP